VHLNPEYVKKQVKASKALVIRIINPVRPQKKLLVLDLDYTLFDMKTKHERYMDLKRPFTDELNFMILVVLSSC